MADLVKNVLVLSLVTTTGFQAEVIRDRTNCDYSHIDLVNQDGTRIGAHLDGGVAVRPANYEKFTKELRGIVSCTPDQFNSAQAWIHAQVGKKYDLTAVIGTGLQRDWTSPDAWFCFELIAAMMWKTNIPFLNPIGALHVNRIVGTHIMLSPYLKWLEPHDWSAYTEA